MEREGKGKGEGKGGEREREREKVLPPQPPKAGDATVEINLIRPTSSCHLWSVHSTARLHRRQKCRL